MLEVNTDVWCQYVRIDNLQLISINILNFLLCQEYNNLRNVKKFQVLSINIF